MSAVNLSLVTCRHEENSCERCSIWATSYESIKFLKENFSTHKRINLEGPQLGINRKSIHRCKVGIIYKWLGKVTCLIHKREYIAGKGIRVERRGIELELEELGC